MSSFLFHHNTFFWKLGTMKSFEVLVILVLTSGGFAHPLKEDVGEDDGSPQPITTENASTEFPILEPSEDEFAISRPTPIDESGGSNQGENTGDDKPVERPYPVLEKLQIEEFRLGGLRRKHREEDEDDDIVVIDPIDEDTVVVEAITCEELLQACEEDDDLLSCQAYNENCYTSDEDEAELIDFINCTNDNANGASGKCPLIHGR